MTAPRHRRLHPAGLLGAAGAVVLSLQPWMLPPPPAVQVTVTAILAAHGYAAGALVRIACRWLRSLCVRVRVPRARLLATAGVLELLATGCLPATGPASGITPENSALRAGQPGALVPWHTLGREGQVFVGGGPDPATIQRVTGRPALRPVRAYVGIRSASTAAQRAGLALDALELTGSFSRSAILVVIPTGSGWVSPAAVASLEYLTGGDLATVAVQYAERPSWLEHLLGSGRAEDAAITLLTALRHRLDQIAAPDRPRLLVYGESLGATAARRTSSWADRSLLVGQPGIAWTHLPLGRTTSVLHSDDPVGWWSPRLLVQRPDGWPGRWLPVVSFWQVSGSLLAALDAPAGHGHRYRAELVDAWRQTVPGGPPGVLPPNRLDAVRRAVA